MTNCKAKPDAGGADRRDHARYRIEGAEVEYVKVDFLAFVDKDMRQRDDLGNVSEGGMLIMAAEDFPTGQNLSLCLLIPGTAEPLRMRGAVVWTSACGDGRRYEVGVKLNMCGSRAAKLLGGLAQWCKESPDRVALYVKSD